MSTTTKLTVGQIIAGAIEMELATYKDKAQKSGKDHARQVVGLQAPRGGNASWVNAALSLIKGVTGDQLTTDQFVEEIRKMNNKFVLRQTGKGYSVTTVEAAANSKSNPNSAQSQTAAKMAALKAFLENQNTNSATATN